MLAALLRPDARVRLEGLRGEDKMIHPLPTVCQWSNCGARPSKHVLFGLRIFDSPKAPDIDTPYILDHRDLCDRHVDEVRSQYFHVSVCELGKCAADHVTTH